MRSALALAFSALALASCGYAEDEAGGASPRETFELFASAVVEGDAAATDFVTRELDGDERDSFVSAMRRDFEPWARGYRVIFDSRVTDDVAIVAAQGENHPGPGAYAAVLVRDGDAWFIEPNDVGLVYGRSGGAATRAAKPVVDFGMNVSGRDVDPEARLWLDGNEVRLRHQPSATRHTFRADIRRLERRVYSAMAFVQIGARRGAIAWTFRAR